MERRNDMQMEVALAESVSGKSKETTFPDTRKRRLKEKMIEKFFLLNGLLAIFVLGGIFALLFLKAFPVREIESKTHPQMPLGIKRITTMMTIP